MHYTTYCNVQDCTLKTSVSVFTFPYTASWASKSLREGVGDCTSGCLIWIFTDRAFIVYVMIPFFLGLTR